MKGAQAGPRWFAHQVERERRLGVACDERYFDLGPLDEKEALAFGGLDARAVDAALAHARPIAGVPHFAVPVANPSKILCLGKNYAAHAAEFGAKVPEEPFYFAKLAETLLPHKGTVLLPRWVETRIDHEIELGVVLGFQDPDRAGVKFVAARDAMQLVAGFTVLNDVTARDLQGEDRAKKHPWLRSKSFDTFCPIGPWVVPREHLPNVHDLAISLTVNGVVRQQSKTSKMVVSIADAIAWLSKHHTLRPGDIVAMGTPEGVGPIQPGDVMSGEIEGIGQLVNPVARE